MLVTLTLPLTHVKDEVKSVVAVTTPLILVKNEVKYERYTFEWCQRWEQMCNELLLQTFMSKLILRKEINKLYLNTVLKIFIRQYRTRAGNHGNCCFTIIFVNVLEYVLFRSEIFFCLMLSGSFSPWSINIRCNDSDAKQWLNNWTMEDWTQVRHSVFGAKLSRLQTLSPPVQTKKQRRSEERKAAFLYEAVHLLLTNIFTLIFDRV